MAELNYTTPPVLVVGDSGTGKSTGISTLPPEKTIILNTENKMMPFPNHNKFKVVDVTSYITLKQLLGQLMSEEGAVAYDYVILDSFTSLTEIIEKWANSNFSGFNQWKEYNSAIYDVVFALKRLPQQVFVLGIPEQKDVEFGETKQYLRVKGKELKYQIEKEFSVVMFTFPVYDEDTGEMTNVKMVTRSNKRNTAKSPMGMFTEPPTNDYAYIANKIKEFYGHNTE